MINLSLFTATSGDYSTITNVITADDAIALSPFTTQSKPMLSYAKNLLILKSRLPF